ncbi:Hypothetical predicted protein [Olea europaea subsp. europaea]|uniref:Uncharacterized protein n=1 Tax=Olea europaea subsp. europaea TaxID=158383 RepID=A0A8S0UG49_OLEEU|nr:Hypothetical predicted protein [Olea europaea subsp. europaea]
MEGVGARLGRSSTRYGPTTVFTGPVRKWKKKWVHASAFNSNNHDHQTPNGNANGSSHLLFYKWTVITPSQNKDNNGGDSNNGNNNVSSNGDSKNSDKVDSFAVEEPPKRKFKLLCWRNKKMSCQNKSKTKLNQLSLMQTQKSPRIIVQKNDKI